MIRSLLPRFFIALVLGALGSTWASGCLGYRCGWESIGQVGVLEVGTTRDLPFTVESASIEDFVLTLTWSTEDGRSGMVSWEVEDLGIE